MNEIVTSLKKYKESKKLLSLLRRMDRGGQAEHNLARHLIRLYHEDLIDRSEYLAIRAKVIMGHHISVLRKLSPDLKSGIRFYETQSGRIWNASVASLPESFNEYTQGLHVAFDLSCHSSEPVYTQDILVVDHVARSEHPVVINHKKHFLQADILSYVTVPIRYKGQSIGHQLIASDRPREFSEHEITLFSNYSRLLEKELASVKAIMIQQFHDSCK